MSWGVAGPRRCASFRLAAASWSIVGARKVCRNRKLAAAQQFYVYLPAHELDLCAAMQARLMPRLAAS